MKGNAAKISLLMELMDAGILTDQHVHALISNDFITEYYVYCISGISMMDNL